MTVETRKRLVPSCPDWVVISISAISIVLVAASLRVVRPELFELRWQPFAWLPILEIITNSALLFYVLRRPTRNRSMLWFALFIVAGIGWGYGEMMQQLSATPGAALVWHHLIWFSCAFLGPLFYLFVSRFVAPQKASNFIKVVLLGASGLTANFAMNQPEMPASLMPWGYNFPTSFMESVFLTWAAALGALAVGRLVFYLHHSSRIEDRKTIMWFMLMAILVICVAIIDILLAALGINAPSFSVLANSILAVGSLYLIRRNKLFYIDTETVAENALSMMEEAVLVIDSNYRVTYANKWARHLFGRGGELSPNATLKDLDPKVWACRDQWENQLHDHPSALVEHIQLGGGVAQILVTPYTDAARSMIMVFTDVTKLEQTNENARREASQLGLVNKSLKDTQAAMANLLEDARDLEGQLKREKASVERKVEERTSALVAMQKSRDEFFSIASHELRTPLTAIRGNTSLMMQYYSEKFTDPDLKEMIGDIHESSMRLISVVNDFLDMSRLEQGKISFKPSAFQLKDLAGEVIDECKATGMFPKLSLELKSPNNLPPVLADHDRLKQVLLNLVGNGLKFTEQGGVTIELKALLKAVQVEVMDTGRGIPADSQDRLFRKFQQASNNILTRDSTKSTGLGLYISRLIMEGMGGMIELAWSNEGKGSCFRLVVPLATKKSKIPAAKVGAHVS